MTHHHHQHEHEDPQRVDYRVTLIYIAIIMTISVLVQLAQVFLW